MNTHACRTRAALLAAAVTLWGTFAAPAQEAGPALTVTPDPAADPPGSVYRIFGTGFLPGEALAVQVLRADGSTCADPSHEPCEVASDELGSFEADWLACPGDGPGTMLIATCTGLASASAAEALFWSEAAPMEPPGAPDGASALLAASPSATTFTRIHSFTGTDGRWPWAPVMQGTDRCIYGTTDSGGTFNRGTLFKIHADGSGFAVLRNFAGSDGSNPRAPPIEASDGWLYGTTRTGGSGGAGTVFKIRPDGSGFAVIKNFPGGSADGIHPTGPIMQGSDGFLYGTTYAGGLNGRGTICRIRCDGSSYAILRHFAASDGRYPFSGLIQGSDGAFYGTTYMGGTADGGTVFRVTSSGSFAVLRSFTGGNGLNPYAGLLQGSDGALYGTTENGGAWGKGAVFRLGMDGSGLAAILSFNVSNGVDPYATLVQGGDATLFGTAYAGGSGGWGVVFSMNSDGSGFKELKSFGTSSAEGTLPWAGVVQGDDGSLYGTTMYGGAADFGTVFRIDLTPPNAPPVAQCRNVTVAAGADCMATASIDDGSYDPDAEDAVTLAQSPPGPFPLGDTTVTLTATDSHGASSTCSAIVTVVEAQAPALGPLADLSVGSSEGLLVPVTYPVPVVSDNCDPAPAVSFSPTSGSGFPIGATTVTCRAEDDAGNGCSGTFTVTRAALEFTGFLPPIGGEIAMGTGGSFADPVRAFRLGSTLPVKFLASSAAGPVVTGAHALQAVRYSSAVDSDPPVDATPTDAATTGNLFRLTDAATGAWHFNLSTKTGFSQGTWKLVATLSDGSVHEVWVSIKR